MGWGGGRGAKGHVHNLVFVLYHFDITKFQNLTNTKKDTIFCNIMIRYKVYEKNSTQELG